VKKNAKKQRSEERKKKKEVTMVSYNSKFKNIFIALLFYYYFKLVMVLLLVNLFFISDVWRSLIITTVHNLEPMPYFNISCFISDDNSDEDRRERHLRLIQY
jgi:hypothetical protein